jgi:hypothetical protein
VKQVNRAAFGTSKNITDFGVDRFLSMLAELTLLVYLTTEERIFV